MDPDPYLYIIASHVGVLFAPGNITGIICCVAVLLFLLFLSGLIASYEAAFFALSQDDIKKVQDDNNPESRKILEWLNQPERLLATIIAANCFINIAFIILAILTFQSVSGSGEGLFLQTILIIVVLLLFGEIIPKVFVTQKARNVSYRMVISLTVFEVVLYPLVRLLSSSTLFINKRLQKKQSISIDELSDVLEKSSDTIVENKDILKGIVKFGNIDTHTIMTSRIDVVSVDIETKLPELIDEINEWGYSRLPVYEDNPDNIKGILYVKDLLSCLDEGENFKWQSLIRDAYFVPENKKIDDLLKEFQEKKIHVAVIIDEYGGMAGIVTLEDVLEEIMGEIADESDDDEPEHEQIDARTYLFDGKVLLNDFYRIMHIEDTIFNDIRGEADTLAGIILELKGEIPKNGDCVDYQHLSFCVEEMENRRIKRIKVIVNEPE
ncbi:MAG: gliding motility-associated protein GldE [Bacteroidales bacterium]|nr:gliding motility-associated protein GldE [Bacteroidales bacterium]